MAWINYDMVPHTWISECLELFGITNNVQYFFLQDFKNAPGKKVGEVDIRRRTFQGDSLYPLLLVLCMVSLIWLLRGAKDSY